MKSVAAPEISIWRVGHRPDPLAFHASSPDLGRGSRYDSPVAGRYGVLYFASSLEACFGESLARFAIDQSSTSTSDIWSEPSWMDPRSVAADWRNARITVHIKLKENLCFVDMSAPETQQYIFQQLASEIPALEHKEQILWSNNRRITRPISGWIYDQKNPEGKRRYSGIYYPSRLNARYGVDWRCWAVFADDRPWQVLPKKPIPKTDPSLQKVARLFGLTVH